MADFMLGMNKYVTCGPDLMRAWAHQWCWLSRYSYFGGGSGWGGTGPGACALWLEQVSPYLSCFPSLVLTALLLLPLLVSSVQNAAPSFVTFKTLVPRSCAFGSFPNLRSHWVSPKVTCRW